MPDNGHRSNSLAKLTGKTIISAHLENNKTTLSLVISGGRKITINSGSQIVISLERRQPSDTNLHQI